MRFFREVRDTSIMLAAHPRVLKFDIVGSYYVDEPKDIDFLVLVKGTGFLGHDSDEASYNGTAIEDAARWAFGGDWQLCGGEYDDQTDMWGAIRNGDVNLIVTVDPGWYERCLLASNVCAALKLQDKGDRIVTHRVIRDGYTPEQANIRRGGSR